MKISIKLIITGIFFLASYASQQLYAMDYTHPVQEKLTYILSAVQADIDYLAKGKNKPYRPSLTAQINLSDLTPDLKTIFEQKIADFNKSYNVAAFNKGKIAEFQTNYVLITSYAEELLKHSNHSKKTTPITNTKTATPKITSAKKSAAAVKATHKKSSVAIPKIVPAKKTVITAQKASVNLSKTSVAPVKPIVKPKHKAAHTVAHVQAMTPKKETFVQKKYKGMAYTICDWSGKVNKQTGSTCAFHTIKNGRIMLNYLTGAVDKHTAEHQLKAAPDSIPQFPLSSWQNYIGKNDNLDEEELRRIAIQANFPTHNLAIIQNIRKFDAAHLLMKDTEFNNLCRAIKAAQNKEPMIHVFALGTMTESVNAYSGKLEGNDGHWICVVLHIDVDKKIAFYTFDSASITGSTTQLLTEALVELLSFDTDVLKAIRKAE